MKANYTRYHVLGFVCALAVVISGTAAAQSGPEPCKLLTPAQVSSALGVTVGAGVPIATTGCSWSSPPPQVTATLSLWDATKWEKMKGVVPGMMKTPASGLGDDAFYTTGGTGTQLSTLSVKKGTTAFVFHIYGVKEASNQMSMEKMMAENVLAKL